MIPVGRNCDSALADGGIPQRASLSFGSTIQRQGFRPEFSKPFLKYPLAALIQSFAMATVHHFLEQTLHRPDLRRQLPKFHQFSARDFLPALRCRSRISKAKEQLPDFMQGEPGLPRPLDHRQAMKHGRIVASLPADPLSRKKDSNLFVVPNCGGLKTNLSRYLRNG